MTHNRYRCRSCGNKTRFQVVRSLKTSTFEHLNIDGTLMEEEVRVVQEIIESVECLKCDGGKVVELDEQSQEHELTLGFQ